MLPSRDGFPRLSGSLPIGRIFLSARHPRPGVGARHCVVLLNPKSRSSTRTWPISSLEQACEPWRQLC